MKYLVIIEVSQKQKYIFSSNKLSENVDRSKEIRYVTGASFFEKADPEFKLDNLINSGGGHTVLQFSDEESAKRFVKRVTKKALEVFPGMELFAKILPVTDEELKAKTPGDIFLELTKALEQKKSLRLASMGQISFGVEKMDPYTRRPDIGAGRKSIDLDGDIISPPAGIREWPYDFRKIAKGPDASENASRGAEELGFIAVVHADGNAMGTRVGRVYESNKNDWDGCCKALRDFSEEVDNSFRDSFIAMSERFIETSDRGTKYCPIRPVILAGDDICYVTRGELGVRSAVELLKEISKKDVNGKTLSACAGIAIVHAKYPFHKAYDLSEELCSSAKKFGSNIDPAGGISAVDWHIDYGQTAKLSHIRGRYLAEDGSSMTLRPLAVVVPDGIKDDTICNNGVRTWNFFESRIESLSSKLESKDKDVHVSRGALKELRTYIAQGEEEALFFAEYSGIDGKLGGRDGMYATVTVKPGAKPLRCSLIFDAIELFDEYDQNAGRSGQDE